MGMRGMLSQQWKQFLTTGSVEDYLRCRMAEDGEMGQAVRGILPDQTGDDCHGKNDSDRYGTGGVSRWGV